MKRKRIILHLALLSLIVLISSACKDTPIPKPHGYLRIDMPDHAYQALNDSRAPFTFEMSQEASFSQLRIQREHRENVKWFNVSYKKYDATVHLSYIPVDKNLDSLHEESHQFVFEHTVKADAIDEVLINKPKQKIYGLMYDLQGNTASNMEFYISDSTSHFLRGALYLNTTPNIDSLAPIVNYIKEDIVHMLNTIEWTCQ